MNGEINAPIKYPGAFTISKNSPNEPTQIQLIGNRKSKAILSKRAGYSDCEWENRKQISQFEKEIFKPPKKDEGMRIF